MEKIIITMLGICLLSLTSATTIYSGGTYYTDLTDKIQNLQTVECEIINNHSNLEGLNFTVNNTGYIIVLAINYKPDNFTVSCLLNGYKMISINSGGSNACYVNWTCSEWSTCQNGQSNRTFKKIPKRCFGNPIEKPSENKSCKIDSEIIILDNQTFQENCSIDNETICIKEIEEIGFFYKLKIWTNKVIDFLIFWK